MRIYRIIERVDREILHIHNVYQMLKNNVLPGTKEAVKLRAQQTDERAKRSAIRFYSVCKPRVGS